MSATPLTDAYLASRCKGENKQSWVEFARGLEEKLREAQGAIETMPVNRLALYIYGGCTENECELCRTPQGWRSMEARHAGIPSYPYPAAPK